MPTVAESGLTEYDTGVWWGVLAPAGLPADIQARLSQDCADAMKTPAVKERFRTLGATPIGGTAADFAQADPRRLRQVGTGHQGRRHQGRVTAADDR